MDTDEPGVAARPLLPIAGRLRAVNVAFMIWFGWAGLSILFQLWLVLTFSGIEADPLPGRFIQLGQFEAWSLLVQVPVSLATGITFVVWLFRARDNAERLSPRPHRRSRAWAFWGWVVPVVWFWFPFQVVDDIRQCSARPGSPGPSGALLGLWWALFLTHEFGGFVPTGSQDVRSSLLEELLFWPISIAAAVLALRVVRQISAAQAVSSR